jgi:hypothetical protein
MADTPTTCPHCNARLKKWLVPVEASWAEEFFYVCFNNECSYYKAGWIRMEEEFGQHGSYRYMLNPGTGASSMIPVWSESATQEMIVEEDEIEGKDKIEEKDKEPDSQ